MTKKVKSLAEQALFASAIFILFLLLFESKIVVPTWMQPVGRMHPLFLHFPIVILLLAMAMEMFRFNSSYATNEFYRGFLSNLLLVGVLSAAVTVVMGLFLSKEEGYSGDMLQWHKWSGVSLFYLSCLIYWSRNQAWYQATVAKSGAILAVFFLIGAGHYGAVLTHGDNFITGPITNTNAEPVALDQALVYDHVIQPIFQQKCISCHNPDKLKGELNLADVDAILKGGKSGKLFKAGLPDQSLLLQRIHLPAEEKKHMPPTGKTQLTSDEITLLALWVKSKPDFKKKVVDLPPTDSLRRIAAVLFKPAEQTEEVYDFDAADEETVKKLNNDYRTVAYLAKESPALAVNLYNRSIYSVEKLQELSEIKQQVVSLNLNKMPVKDADLKTVAQFENLQKLDLNFTDISGQGLKELAGLKHLNSLTLSGTKVTYADLQKQIGDFKSLKTVSLWETKLTIPEIQQLQKANKNIAFIAGFKDDGKDPITLNPPQVKNSSMIFDKPVALQLNHPIKGVQIRFTTDGTEPDSIHSPVFNNQTILTDMTTIKARAFKDGWFGSSLATFDFYKSTYKPDSVALLLPLNRVHQAEGAKSLFDHKLGTFNANSPAWANNWTGVRNNDMVLMAEYKKPVTVSSVALRIMVEEATGIFPPGSVEIWGGDSRDKLKLLSTVKPKMPVKGETHELKNVTCTFKPQTVTYLKIVAKPCTLPEWHGGKGKPGLVLVDEMFIN
ncbi:chitobiase/beta-hexosaminidase C-terminal domain-containing protein [Larkinella knui]|uniref:Cytochrome C n=1 Tax=Larkinella knui TaxID=2025310 RepID=A0A3P1CQU7_9BACT|nr:c-type cytochrome domain-containing protein [Larkinella knui]RRB15628.1 cytochrome C [Larkinella knui]